MLLLRRFLLRLSGASLSPFGAYLLRFLRMVLLARMLSPHDLGSAVALITIIGICEMVTDVGLDRFVMVSSRQDQAQVVAAARQIALARASLLAVAIAAFSPLLARVFGAEDQVGTIALLGLASLVGGFRNWRVTQVQREYRYAPEAIASIGGQLAAVAAVVPAVLWLGDGRAILVILLAEVVTNVFLTHVVVTAQPVSRVDPAIRRSAFAFGLPLLINGVGLAAIKQFDQVVVANIFDLASLALYTLGLNLAIVPTSLLQVITQKLGLPYLGNAGANSRSARRASMAVLLGYVGLGAAYALCVGAVLDLAVPLVYGGQYVVSGAFCALAMLDAFLRLCRAGPNMILLHHGQTRSLMLGNLAACVGLAASIGLASWSGRMEGVVGGLVIGDAVSFLVLLALVRHHVPLAGLLAHLGALTAATVLGAVAFWLTGTPSFGVRAVIVVLGGLVVGLDAALLYRSIGRQLFQPGRREAQDRPVLAGTIVKGEVGD